MRIAIIGCGSAGRRHLRNLQAEDRHELLVYDPDPNAQAHLEHVLKISPCTSLEQVWDARPEAAVIAAPPNQQMGLAFSAAEKGVHVFIEPPVSNNLADVEKLAVRARESKLTAMVGSNMRFHPGPLLAKSLLTDGCVGPLLAARLQSGSYLPDWRPASDYRTTYSAQTAQGGGALLDCIQEIDLALWYFGPAEVKAAVTQPAFALGLKVEGVAEVTLLHLNGVLSTVHLNIVQRDYRRTCQIIGEHGTIYWDFENPWLEIRNGAGLERRHPLDVHWQVNQMYVDEMRHFLDCVGHLQSPQSPLEDGIAALKMALRAREIAAAAAIKTVV